MLNAIIRFALNHRLLTVAVSAFIVAYGAVTVKDLPIDVFPDITKPTVTIMTESHGMAPEEVETRVTAPIESFLTGLPGVERIRSQSGIGLSAIYVEFQWQTDIHRSRQLIQERLNLAQERLPQDITPIMGPVGSLMGQIQQIAVYSEDNSLSSMEVRSLAEWNLRPVLMSIPGVAQVITIGGGLKQYQILVSAEKLNSYQLSIEQVDKELAQVSQNTTGGFLEKKSKMLEAIPCPSFLDDFVLGFPLGRRHTTLRPGPYGLRSKRVHLLKLTLSEKRILFQVAELQPFQYRHVL